MTTRVGFALATVGIVAVAGGQLFAHHAFSAEFDADKAVHMVGVIKSVEWVNPHSWIHMDVKTPDGSIDPWMIEGGPPNALIRRGLTSTLLGPGTEIIVEGFQAKDGSRRANGRDIVFADGRRIFMGTSGTGAPGDPTGTKKK